MADEITAENQVSFWRQGGSFVLELVKIIVLSIAIIIPIRLFLIQPFYVQGASMKPNFFEHDYLLVDEITYGVRNPVSGDRVLGGRAPERGEIIVFTCSFDACEKSKGDYLIKRVIGLPGETVEIKTGQIFITKPGDNKAVELVETYLPSGQKLYRSPQIGPVTLGQDEYYVMGDNRGYSFDSEDFGAIKKSMIIGRVWVRGWPFNRAANFTVPSYEGIK